MLASFNFKDHIVMVFDKLGLSLFDFLKSNSYRGFAAPHVKLVGLQLLRATKCSFCACE
jgi:hypothetical protein